MSNAVLYQRKPGGVWYCDFIGANGKRLRRSSGTPDKLKAQEWADKEKARVWDEKRLGVKPKRFLDEAVLRWLKEKRIEGKKSLGKDVRYLGFWLGELGGKRSLDSITYDVMREVLDEQEKWAVGTKNLHVAALRGVLYRARDKWHWIDRCETMSQYSGATERSEWLTPAQAIELISALPEWLKGPCRLALATGLRCSNVFKLEWNWINLQSRMIFVPGAKMKSGEQHGVPINDDALKVLRAQIGKHQTYVFVDMDGKPRDTYSNAWWTALEKVGLTDFHWHDLRHTWASWHLQGGTPETVLMKLGGWSSMKFVARYAHIGTVRLAEYANNSKLRIARIGTPSLTIVPDPDVDD